MAKALTYFPDPNTYQAGRETYLEHIGQAKESVGIPIIASWNGSTLGDWVDYSQKIQEAGADALELNIYSIPTDPHLSGAQMEEDYLFTVKAVRADVTIPLSVKLRPFFTPLANMAMRLDQAGANGLILFNRFLQADISPEELEVGPPVVLG